MKIFTHKDKKQLGPFSLEEVRFKMANEELSGSDPAWVEGWAEWRTISAVPGIRPDEGQSGVSAEPGFQSALDASEAFAPEIPKPEATFFYIPIARLILMSILTMGIFEAYWMYRNWRYLRERDGMHISPFWRAMFGFFFVNALLSAIRSDKIANRHVPAVFPSGWLAAGWILCVLVGNVLSRSSDVSLNYFGLVISMPSFLFLVPAQNYIIRVNESLLVRPRYARWTAVPIVILLFGIVAWAGVMLDILVPME